MACPPHTACSCRFILSKQLQIMQTHTQLCMPLPQPRAQRPLLLVGQCLGGMQDSQLVVCRGYKRRGWFVQGGIDCAEGHSRGSRAAGQGVKRGEGSGRGQHKQGRVLCGKPWLPERRCLDYAVAAGRASSPAAHQHCTQHLGQAGTGLRMPLCGWPHAQHSGAAACLGQHRGAAAGPSTWVHSSSAQARYLYSCGSAASRSR